MKKPWVALLLAGVLLLAITSAHGFGDTRFYGQYIAVPQPPYRVVPGLRFEPPRVMGERIESYRKPVKKGLEFRDGLIRYR